ncbi:Pentatricopeptide repeat-containing protein, partial [Drosera capensis]
MTPTRRLLSFPHLLRRLCSASSAAAAAEPAETTAPPILPYAGVKKKRPRKPRLPMKTLLGRISEIGSTGGKVEDVLNGYVREGNAIRKDDLFMCVRNIRKVRRFQHCNELGKMKLKAGKILTIGGGTNKGLQLVSVIMSKLCDQERELGLTQ